MFITKKFDTDFQKIVYKCKGIRVEYSLLRPQIEEVLKEFSQKEQAIIYKDATFMVKTTKEQKTKQSWRGNRAYLIAKVLIEIIEENS